MPITPYIRVVFPFMGSLPFLFLDDFEGNANISVTIKCSSTVVHITTTLFYSCMKSPDPFVAQEEVEKLNSINDQLEKILRGL